MIFQIWRSSSQSRLPHRRAHYSTEQVHSDSPVWGQSSKLLPCTYSRLQLSVFSYTVKPEFATTWHERPHCLERPFFSCTDAILVHFTLSPAPTWQTRPVAYLELVIYLLNATIIMLQNTKLTVKLTRDGRPYPHLTPHCRWPGRLLFMVSPCLTGTTGSQTPCGLLTIAHLISLASLNVFSHV